MLHFLPSPPSFPSPSSPKLERVAWSWRSPDIPHFDECNGKSESHCKNCLRFSRAGLRNFLGVGQKQEEEEEGM